MSGVRIIKSLLSSVVTMGLRAAKSTAMIALDPDRLITGEASGTVEVVHLIGGVTEIKIIKIGTDIDIGKEIATGTQTEIKIEQETGIATEIGMAIELVIGMVTMIEVEINTEIGTGTGTGTGTGVIEATNAAEIQNVIMADTGTGTDIGTGIVGTEAGIEIGMRTTAVAARDAPARTLRSLP